MIDVTCPTCGCQRNAKDNVAGKRVKCPDCGETFVVHPAVPFQPLVKAAGVSASTRRTTTERRSHWASSFPVSPIVLAGGGMGLLLLSGLVVLVIGMFGGDAPVQEEGLATAGAPSDPSLPDLKPVDTRDGNKILGREVPVRDWIEKYDELSKELSDKAQDSEGRYVQYIPLDESQIDVAFELAGLGTVGPPTHLRGIEVQQVAISYLALFPVKVIKKHWDKYSQLSPRVLEQLGPEAAPLVPELEKMLVNCTGKGSSGRFYAVAKALQNIGEQGVPALHTGLRLERTPGYLENPKVQVGVCLMGIFASGTDVSRLKQVVDQHGDRPVIAESLCTLMQEKGMLHAIPNSVKAEVASSLLATHGNDRMVVKAACDLFRELRADAIVAAPVLRDLLERDMKEEKEVFQLANALVGLGPGAAQTVREIFNENPRAPRASLLIGSIRLRNNYDDAFLPVLADALAGDAPGPIRLALESEHVAALTKELLALLRLNEDRAKAWTETERAGISARAARLLTKAPISESLDVGDYAIILETMIDVALLEKIRGFGSEATPCLAALRRREAEARSSIAGKLREIEALGTSRSIKRTFSQGRDMGAEVLPQTTSEKVYKHGDLTVTIRRGTDAALATQFEEKWQWFTEIAATIAAIESGR